MMPRGRGGHHRGETHGGAHHLPTGPQYLDPRKDIHYRIPPCFNPRTNHEYQFRKYVQVIVVWCLHTDLRPEQQAAAIITQLQGQAKDLVINTMTPAQIATGGLHPTTGDNLDPVSYILATLATRFTPYPDEEANRAK